MSRRCVILVGMMGAGKTEVGQELAETLGYDFLDTDALITVKAKKSINSIFDQEGETTFREMEREMIDGLKGQRSTVVAVGGGAMLDPANRAVLRSIGQVIYLKASPRELYLRIKNDRSRPLLLNKENPQGILSDILSERESFYDMADITIDTEEISVPEVVDKIIDELAKRTVETQTEY